MGIRLSVLILIFTAVYGCEPVGDCFSGKGSMVKDERPSGIIKKIDVGHNIYVNVWTDSINRLVVEGPENLLPEITSDTAEGVLSMKNLNTCQWSKGYDYDIVANIHASALEEIHYAGGAILTSPDTLRLEKIHIHSNSTGSIKLNIKATSVSAGISGSSADMLLAGETQKFHINMWGNGLIDARHLKADNVSVWCQTDNNIYVHANKTLKVTINGEGKVFYTGNPTEVSVNGPNAGGLVKVE